MLRIGVIADTHLADTGEALAFLLELAGRQFREAGVILHAGDIVAPGVLAAFAPRTVYGVRGNMDPVAPGLAQKRVLNLGGAMIGMIHGWGPPAGLVERIRGEFRGTPLDCLVFGHSHVPMCRLDSGLLLFNPGSATAPRGLPGPSVGLLEVADGKVSGRIVSLGENGS